MKHPFDEENRYGPPAKKTKMVKVNVSSIWRFLKKWMKKKNVRRK